MSSVKPRPSRPRHKPRPRARPRLWLPTAAPAPPLPPPPPPRDPVRVRWSPRSLTLEHLVREHPLPQLVQCRTQGMQTAGGGPVTLPLDKPILLAHQRTARHLLARMVIYDDHTRSFNESVNSVVIPEDFEGRFLRLQSRTTKDKTKVKSLETIAHDDTPAFLNLSEMTSFPAHARDPGDQSRLIYTVGNVFLVDEPLPSEPDDTRSDGGGSGGQPFPAVSDSSRLKSATASSDGRGSNGMMRCLDERGLPIVVPTDQMGEMVTVQGNGAGEGRLSVKSSDMIVNQQFPLLARYAYSKRRPRLTAFSKLLTLLDSFQETTVLACIVDSASVMLMEIPLTSSLNFHVALNREEVLRAPRMRRALEACGSRGPELSRDLKFKYKFSHRVQESSRRLVKVREEDDLPSATMRTRLVATETYLYI